MEVHAVLQGVDRRHPLAGDARGAVGVFGDAALSHAQRAGASGGGAEPLEVRAVRGLPRQPAASIASASRS